ncbi:MAG TPA: molybdenum ABC transporter ATP-binding protein [Geminicoccus sp.]|uniref:molybdenum ABC transporter ATP-binding protein n=1 Tax=Geminicoccus sp. TaxID=2024832 RepID=UPI002E30110C|nr:molybdenum ABC transporter ATP-binding protein [Geminicoccus sp.]HEX2529791.1 molybdenum ABC transporter ATP-binding protein [Geminicoccus sp.]
MTGTSLEIDIRHRQGDFLLQAAFTAPAGLTALFGRSGSGKTTLVNAIAGLLRPDHGRILVDGRPLLDTSRGLHLPAHLRRVGYVFQDARLFPHLTVRQNLHYGHWFTSRAERTADADAIVAMLGIGHLLGRRPAALSGGEKQRVAIGRALMASPKLLLMDEPLASLDDARKTEILPFVERIRDEASVPIVYVSHSVAEIGRLATTVVMLADGRAVAAGPTAQIIAQPDLFEGSDRAEAGTILHTRIDHHDHEFALTVLSCPAGRIDVPAIPAPPGTSVRLRIRARDVTLATTRPDHSSAQNILTGFVTAIQATDAPVTVVQLDCHGERLTAQVTRRAVAMLGLRVGSSVFAIVKSVTFDPTAVSP